MLNLKLKYNIWDQCWTRTNNQVSNRIWNQIGIQITNQVRDQITHAFRDLVCRQIKEEEKYPAFKQVKKGEIKISS